MVRSIVDGFHDWCMLVGLHIHPGGLYSADVWIDTGMLCCHNSNYKLPRTRNPMG